eukprot:1155125-Pelagomonas_calceolata.AAC.5
MIGVNNELAERHVKDIPPRNDTLAGPYGRRADQVTDARLLQARDYRLQSFEAVATLLAHIVGRQTRDDLKRLSKPWLQITEEVRFDEEVGSSLVLLWDCASSVQLSRFLWWHGQVLAEFAAVHSITSALS